MVKKKSEAQKDTAGLERDYNMGNFYRARRQAKMLLSKDGLDENVIAAAKNILHKTGIDPWAIVAGFLTLAFTIIVAFWVGA